MSGAWSGGSARCRPNRPLHPPSGAWYEPCKPLPTEPAHRGRRRPRAPTSAPREYPGVGRARPRCGTLYSRSAPEPTPRSPPAGDHRPPRKRQARRLSLPFSPIRCSATALSSCAVVSGGASGACAWRSSSFASLRRRPYTPLARGPGPPGASAAGKIRSRLALCQASAGTCRLHGRPSRLPRPQPGVRFPDRCVRHDGARPLGLIGARLVPRFPRRTGL